MCVMAALEHIICIDHIRNQIYYYYYCSVPASCKSEFKSQFDDETDEVVTISGFVPYIEKLFDENVLIGQGWTTHESLRYVFPLRNSVINCEVTLHIHREIRFIG